MTENIFIRLLTCIVSGVSTIENVYHHHLNQPTPNNLHPNDCSQKLRYSPFVFNLDRCIESYNTLDNQPNKLNGRFKLAFFWNGDRHKAVKNNNKT